MSLIAPLALAGLAFVPLVLAFYLLKLRREQRPVPSTLLWQRLVADVEANAPWQKLRRSLLLFLQLLLVIVLVLLAARPFLERPAGLARDLVLVVDASASMGATDVAPNRLTVAKAQAIDALRDLPAGGRVSVISAGRTARVVANGTTDLTRVRSAIESIQVESAAGDMADALRLASALAARAGDAQVLVVTDAAFPTPPQVRVGAPVSVIPVGRERHNQAIVALAVRTAPSAVSRSVFISVANLDIEKADRRIEIWGDGRLLEARDLYIDPVSRADVSIDDVPREIAVVEVRLAPREESGVGDQLAVDDRAWAVVPPDRLRKVLLVGDGDPYLQAALTYLPNAELYGVKPADFSRNTYIDQRNGGQLFDLIIVEGTVPADLPPVPILAIAPKTGSPLGDVAGSLKNPGVGSLNPDEPILRYVDLSTLHISEAQKMSLPGWARPIIPGPQGSPLLYAGVRAGIPSAVLAFDPRRSDLPLQVAFPILLSNLIGELTGGSLAPTEAVAPGAPVQLTIPQGATGARVARPDGSTVDLTAGTPGAPSVVYSGTQTLGVYTVTPLGLTVGPVSSSPSNTPGSSASPAGSAGSSASPAGSGGSTASGGPSGSPPTGIDPSTPVRFAVDLFDVGESTITPGSPTALEALGTGGAAASGSPGTSGSPASSPAASLGASPQASSGAASPAPSATGSGGTTRPPARDELWTTVLIVVLVLLLIEWSVYQRDTLARARRGLLTRLGRGPVSTAPGRATVTRREGR
jgi:VWA domain-containing protein/aerotolerance regulator-like protein